MGCWLPGCSLVPREQCKLGCRSSVAGFRKEGDWLLPVYQALCLSLAEYVCMLPLQSCLFATLWTVARQAPLSIGFPRQEYWSGLACPSPGVESNSMSVSPALQMDSLTAEPSGKSHTINSKHVGKLFCDRVRLGTLLLLLSHFSRVRLCGTP